MRGLACIFLRSVNSRFPNRSLVWILRAALLAAAAASMWAVAGNLRVFPRTEDAEVRANVVGIAPQVGGTIVRLHVVDNQLVNTGDLLFELDARPYQAEMARAKAQLDLTALEVNALRDEIAAAEAALRERQARATYAGSHYERLKPLLEGNFASADRVQRAQTEAESTRAVVREAEAALERARNKLGEFEGRNTRIEQAAATLRDAELKVSYCKVFAPCAGTVTNLQIAPGSYAATGEQMFSLVDESAWFVLANFRETDLRRIRPGQRARVFLMSQRDNPVSGIVQGIPKAVFPLGTASQGQPGGEGVFARVQPTFDFIQLAQRFPVRILIENKGDFRMGGRAAVVVDTRSEADLGQLETAKSIEEQGFTPPVRND